MWKTPMTTVPTSPAHCMKPWCLNQRQLDQQCCRSQLWTKTKEKMQSLFILLKQVRTEAKNKVSWIIPDTEQWCDGHLCWHTFQLLWSTFSCTDGQRRPLVVLLSFFFLFYFEATIPKTCQNKHILEQVDHKGLWSLVLWRCSEPHRILCNLL